MYFNFSKKKKQITESDPPEGRNRKCMLELQLRDKRLIFCAESPDDMR